MSVVKKRRLFFGDQLENIKTYTLEIKSSNKVRKFIEIAQKKNKFYNFT